MIPQRPINPLHNPFTNPPSTPNTPTPPNLLIRKCASSLNALFVTLWSKNQKFALFAQASPVRVVSRNGYRLGTSVRCVERGWSTINWFKASFWAV